MQEESPKINPLASTNSSGGTVQPIPVTNSLNEKDKAWSGRFSEPVAELVKRYTASVDFDKRLAEFDIQGSLAHARMLGAQGIISFDDVAAIQAGLGDILKEIQSGRFEWLLDLEDVHLNIEKRLTDKI